MKPLRRGHPISIVDLDASHDDSTREAVDWLRRRGLSSGLVAPIVRQGRLCAFFVLVAIEPRPEWTGETVSTASILAEMLANALDRQHSERERLERDRAMQMVARLSTELIHLRPDSVDTAIRGALTEVGAQTAADGCAVYKISEAEDRAHMTNVWSPAYIHRIGEYRIIDIEPFSWAFERLRAGETVLVPDTTVLGDSAPTLSTALESFGVRSMALIPLMIGGRAIGFCGYVWMRRTRDDLASLEPMLRLLAELMVNVEHRVRTDAELRDLNSTLEDRVQSRTSQLEAAVRELEGFSHSVSHDLRSPLRSINGYAEILREDHGAELSEQAQGFLRDISRATQRMGELIDGLLTLSRISRTDFQPRQANLTNIAWEIDETLRREQPQRDVHLEVATGLDVVGDPRLLRVVLDNLLRNAWKFTARNPSSTIHVGVETEDGQEVFFVRDDGVGFDPLHTSNLFGTFQRLHHIRDFEGHGIGLATVKRIIDLHGGRIWATGAIDQGATIRFTLNATADSAAVETGGGNPTRDQARVA